MQPKPSFRLLMPQGVTANPQNCVLFMIMVVIIAFSSCKPSTSSKPDVTDIPVTMTVTRFEKELFAADSSNFNAIFEQLEQKYPDFFAVYVEHIMKLKNGGDTSLSYRKNLFDFINNKDMRQLYDTCMAKFSDKEIAKMQTELEQCFRYVKYYFPKRPVPQCITHISAFGPAAFTLDEQIIGINLDMYLGSECAFYKSTDFPKFMVRRFELPYIIPNTMKAYAKGLYPVSERENRCIDQMLYEGKLLYFLDLVMPDAPDSLKIAYQQQDIEWCKKNEATAWSYLLEHELLYNSQEREYFRLLNEAPTTSGMPPESPGRVGAWIGWQIIRKYMTQNPNVTFDQLMSIKDGQEILKVSKYKPTS